MATASKHQFNAFEDHPKVLDFVKKTHFQSIEIVVFIFWDCYWSIDFGIDFKTQRKKSQFEDGIDWKRDLKQKKLCVYLQRASNAKHETNLVVKFNHGNKSVVSLSSFESVRYVLLLCVL